jgi:hypothetical protein
VIVLLGEISGRRYDYREILPGVIVAKSSAPPYLRVLATLWLPAQPRLLAIPLVWYPPPSATT